MSKDEKIISRLLSRPKDFTWEEMIKVLAIYGFIEFKKGKTGGSRRKFVDAHRNVIALHKPHPRNIIKHYAIEDVISFLKEKGYIKNE